MPPASLNPELDGELLEGRVAHASLAVPPPSPMCGLQCLLKNKPVRECGCLEKAYTRGVWVERPNRPQMWLFGIFVLELKSHWLL